MRRGDVTNAMYEGAVRRSFQATESAVARYKQLTADGSSLREQTELMWQTWMSLSNDDRTMILSRERHAYNWISGRFPVGQLAALRAQLRVFREDESGFDMTEPWQILLDPEVPPARVLIAIEHARTAAGLKGTHAPLASDKTKEVYHRALLDALKGKLQRKKALTKPNDRSLPDNFRKRQELESRALWEKLRGQISETVQPFITARLQEMESDYNVADTYAQFEAEVHSCFADMLLTLRKLGGVAGREVLEVKRRQVQWALEVLRVAPKRGWTRETLEADSIKKAYRKLSARFHPDRNPGSEHRYAERWREVQEAYELLKNYCGF